MRPIVVLQAWDLLIERVRLLLTGLGQTALDLSLALAVLLVGWLAATVIARLPMALLRLLRFNEAMRGLWSRDRESMRHEPAVVGAWIVHWTVMILALMLAADVLGFDLTHSVGDRLADLVPRVLAAAIVLAVGVAIAMTMGGLARRLFAGAGVRGSRARGQIVSVVLTGVAVLLALEQLGLAAQFIIAVGITAIGAVGLATALAFGLGCRELARDFVVEYLRSLDEDRPAR